MAALEIGTNLPIDKQVDMHLGQSSSLVPASCDKIDTSTMKEPSNKQPATVASEQPKKLSDKALEVSW